MNTWMLVLVAGCLMVGVGGVKAKEPLVVYDFRAAENLRPWEVEDDGVMGGLSAGKLTRDPSGTALFAGEVSLENNGGFSSIQHYFHPVVVTNYHTAKIRLRGDGKRYLFLVESEKNARHYYVHEFQTGTDWETISIPLRDMYPVRRGDRLDRPNFPGETLAQIRIMIANATTETFRLELDRIWLE